MTLLETQRNGEKYKEISERGAKNQRNVTEASERKFLEHLKVLIFVGKSSFNVRNGPLFPK